MRDEERLDLVPALLEVGDVGDDEVDAEHLLVREREPAVDDDDLVAVLEHGQVLADLAHAAQGQDAQGLGGRWQALRWCVGGASEESHLVGLRWGVDGDRRCMSTAVPGRRWCSRVSGLIGIGRASLDGLDRPSRGGSGCGGCWFGSGAGRVGLGASAGSGRSARLGRRVDGLAAAAGAARASRDAMSAAGMRAMSSRMVSLSDIWRKAAAGWYIANASASRAPVAASTGPDRAVHLADARAGHERAQRVPAEGHHQRRVQHLQLAPQVRRAGRHLVRLRVAVARRAALHDVGDEHSESRCQPMDADELRRGTPPAAPTNGRPCWSSF